MFEYIKSWWFGKKTEYLMEEIKRNKVCMSCYEEFYTSYINNKLCPGCYNGLFKNGISKCCQIEDRYFFCGICRCGLKCSSCEKCFNNSNELNECDACHEL